MVEPKKKRRPRRRKQPNWAVVAQIASAVAAIAGCIAPFVR